MSLKTKPQERDKKDLEIINKVSDRLNEEAKDVLSYQTVVQPDDHLEEPYSNGDGEAESLVDIGLIDEILRLSPEERLLQNDRMIRTIMELRDACRST